MSQKVTLAVVVIVIVVAGIFAWKNFASSPAAPNPILAQSNLPEESNSGQNVSANEITPSEVKIIYTDSGFSPDNIAVKIGTTIIFENENDSPFWPAVNPHPIHSGYPTKGGCIDSAFDACRGIESGGSWSFKFDIVGKWRYHNHLRPSYRGIIVVEPS